MSDAEWSYDGVGMSLEVAPGLRVMVYDLDTPEQWVCQVTALDGKSSCVHLVEDDGVYATMAAAQIAGLEVAVKLAKQIEQAASAELRRIKQAAQDVADAALVATHGEVVWTVRDAGFATLHTATVVGHPCCVEVYEGGDAKWYLEPEYYGHPHTWDAPDLETAKIRAAAAALRKPCKRWRVTIQPETAAGRTMQGGEVEVWAVTREGAQYRGAAALNMRFFGGCPVYGEAVEIEAAP